MPSTICASGASIGTELTRTSSGRARGHELSSVNDVVATERDDRLLVLDVQLEQDGVPAFELATGGAKRLGDVGVADATVTQEALRAPARQRVAVELELLQHNRRRAGPVGAGEQTGGHVVGPSVGLLGDAVQQRRGAALAIEPLQRADQS